jgi:hypothetical protein
MPVRFCIYDRYPDPITKSGVLTESSVLAAFEPKTGLFVVGVP